MDNELFLLNLCRRDLNQNDNDDPGSTPISSSVDSKKVIPVPTHKGYFGEPLNQAQTRIIGQDGYFGEPLNQAQTRIIGQKGLNAVQDHIGGDGDEHREESKELNTRDVPQPREFNFQSSIDKTSKCLKTLVDCNWDHPLEEMINFTIIKQQFLIRIPKNTKQENIITLTKSRFENRKPTAVSSVFHTILQRVEKEGISLTGCKNIWVAILRDIDNNYQDFLDNYQTSFDPEEVSRAIKFFSWLKKKIREVKIIWGPQENKKLLLNSDFKTIWDDIWKNDISGNNCLLIFIMNLLTHNLATIESSTSINPLKKIHYVCVYLHILHKINKKFENDKINQSNLTVNFPL